MRPAAGARRAALAALVALVAAPRPGAAYSRIASNWNPDALPIPYRINLSSAPASIGASGAQSASEASFASWSAPSCTAWRTANAGTTALTRARAGDRENSILWITDSWPPELGDARSTIGVTTPLWAEGGYFRDADIQYNAVGFRWSLDGRSGTVDTQSIATHEEGHFLGLNHSSVSGAIMYASYPGGVRRTLHSDDVAGVCAIYPAGSTSGCTSDAQCAGGQRCIGGTCQTPPDGGSGGLGEPCDAMRPCASGDMCVCDGTNCFCSRQCSAVAPCPDGFNCTSTTIGGLCLRGGGGGTGTGGTGDPCSGGADCSSGICVSQGGSAFCSRICTDDCACPADYRCVPTSTPDTSVCARGTNTCAPEEDAGTEEDAGGEPDAEAPDVATGEEDAGAGDARGDGGVGSMDPRCGCRVPAGGRHGAAALGALALALGALTQRRRRRS